MRLYDLSVVSNVFKQGKLDYSDKNYDDAAKSFTLTIDILERDLPSVLLHGAGALQMENDYQDAVQERFHAKSNKESTVPGPYITATHALLLQNRLFEAATCCRAIPTTCTWYPTLVHLLNQVITEVDTRNRWLMRALPTEILNQILTLLLLSTHIQLAFTCRSWNTFMLHEWPGMWLTMDTTTVGDLPDDEDELQQALESIPPNKVGRVKVSLYRRNYDPDQRTAAKLYAMHEYGWNKVEHLRKDKRSCVPI